MRTRALERVTHIFPDLKEVQFLYFENWLWELYERGKNAEIDHLVSVENLRIKDATGAVLEVEESHGGLRI
ncbi:hypothetical protein PNOK_0794400 [Pyrrhoderma noxium]|uniref:Uncharacterized protein n=1 Tax=Pyrrhoderma noxium TaxID=2282107 RepID=A0A286U9X9_9AGAM|nr:hypothetical protein PNOK_0794400 [Pyrrhoderma noxium]